MPKFISEIINSGVERLAREMKISNKIKEQLLKELKERYENEEITLDTLKQELEEMRVGYENEEITAEDLLKKELQFEELKEKYEIEKAEIEKMTLYEHLDIDGLRQELEEMRVGYENGEITVEELSKRELEIVKMIQEFISSEYKYDWSGNESSKMIEDSKINCIGSSMLGISLLKELALTCYTGTVRRIHSSTLVITTDGKIYWIDFTPDGISHKQEEIAQYKENDDSIDITDNSIEVKIKNLKRFISCGEEDIIKFFEYKTGLQSQILNIIARDFYVEGQYEEAILVNKLAIKINPENKVSYIRLISTLYRCKEYDEASEVIDKAIDIFPKDSDFYKEIGDIFLGKNKYEEAIKMYKLAIKINPENKSLYIGLIESLCRTGKIEEIIELYKDSIKIYKDSKETYLIFINIFDNLNLNKQAVSFAERLIEMHDIEIDIKKQAYSSIIRILKIYNEKKAMVNICDKFIDFLRENELNDEIERIVSIRNESFVVDNNSISISRKKR